MALRECQFKIGATSLHVYGHDITLRSIVELRPNDKAFFVIRDPISLLISGFNSRLRQGMPRHHRPWTKYEDAFFGHFGNVSQFISALIDPTHPHHQVAFLGMANSIHTGRRLSHYVVSRRFINRHKAHIDCVLRQSHLSVDFAAFVARLGGDPEAIKLPVDDISTHRTPDSVDKNIPDNAEPALRRLLKAEYAIYDTCQELAAPDSSMEQV